MKLDKATVFVCLCGQCLEDSSSHCPFPVGGGRESPVKHEARGGRARKDQAEGRERARKNRAGGSSTGALCTGFTLVKLEVGEGEQFLMLHGLASIPRGI